MHKKKTKEETIEIINEIQTNLGLNLIGSERISNRCKGDKALIIVEKKEVKNNEIKYEHEVSSAKFDDFYINKLDGMFKNKKFLENRFVIRAYKGLDEEFVNIISEEFENLHKGYPEKCIFLVDKDTIPVDLDLFILKSEALDFS